jgi:hypothetical protein
MLKLEWNHGKTVSIQMYRDGFLILKLVLESRNILCFLV